MSVGAMGVEQSVSLSLRKAGAAAGCVGVSKVSYVFIRSGRLGLEERQQHYKRRFSILLAFLSRERARGGVLRKNEDRKKVGEKLEGLKVNQHSHNNNNTHKRL